MSCCVANDVDGVEVAIDDRVELRSMKHGRRVTTPQEHQCSLPLRVYYGDVVGLIDGRSFEVVL